MEHRDRATGWQYAKLSGHKNENKVKTELDTNKDFQQHFLNRVNRSREIIQNTSIGGLHETNVPSINGKKTKSKTDLRVCLSNNEVINVSIKKSLGICLSSFCVYSLFACQSLISSTTLPLRRNRAIRLGIAMMPLQVSAMPHMRPRSMVAPTMATRE